MKKLNNIFSLFLIVWMGVFTQISTSHIGHGHELISPEASLCADNCEIESHGNAGNECELFFAKRLLENDGYNTITNTLPIEFDENQIWVANKSFYTALDNNVYLVRGPPII